MTGRLLFGLMIASVAAAAIWMAQPVIGDASTGDTRCPLSQAAAKCPFLRATERGPHFPVADQPSDEDLWKELRQRAAENGGRLELDQNDPLGRKLFERMQRGGGAPFGPGLEGMDRLLDDLFQQHRGFRPDDDFGFGPMPEEMRKMLEELHRGGNARGPRQFGGMPDFLKMLEQQDQNREPGEHEKEYGDELRQYREVVAEARRSTVRVLSEGKQVALGAVVDARGFILTKASQLGDNLSVQLADGGPLAAKVVGIHEPFDLALLKIEAGKLTPVRWNRGEAPAVGGLLATPGTGEDALAAGVVSVAPRRPLGARGFLGVGHELTDEGVRVTDVLEGSAAAAAGVQPGDIIRKINDQAIENPMRLNEAVGNQEPAQKIRLQLKRQDREINTEALLGTRELSGVRVERFNVMDRMGSRLSERRDGFPFVLQHDSVLAPEECGGPLVDLSGAVVGINIARAGRVASYAAPAGEVLAVLPDLISGKLAPPEPSVASKIELLDSALKRAEAAAAEADGHAERLSQEIERLKAERQKLLEGRPAGN